MVEMTIADALTELKRIKKLLETKHTNIRRYASKRRGGKDEIENQKDFIGQEKQSCVDLINRYKDIKLAINRSNLTTQLEFGGEKFSVAYAILFKQQFHAMFKELYSCFTPNRGEQLVRSYMQTIGNLGGLQQEQLEKLDMIPELMYSETEIIKLKEGNLNLYSVVDALIEKSNHATNITL